MKKLGLLAIMLVLTGCGSEPENIAETNFTEAINTTEKEESVAVSDNVIIDAEKAIEAFKDNGLSVGQVIFYDEKTDPNKLLNRPNQYTQKVAFEDTSIEQPNSEFLTDGDTPINGGTIEVYPTNEGAIKRKEYIEQVTEGMPMLQQYIYINKTAVLRLEHDILPSDAERYNVVFQSY